jgi:CHASE2 domain
VHRGKQGGAKHSWARHAFVHTLNGTLLGVITAVLVLFASFKFTALKDFDYDFGLQVTQFVDMYSVFKSQGMTPKQGEPSFIFLDADPQPASGGSSTKGSVDACAALSKVRPPDSKGPLNCSLARPLNRYLLAEVVKDVRARGAKLIVLDVDLSADGGVVDAEENLQLLHAILSDVPSATPVIAVRDAEYSPDQNPDELPRVTTPGQALFDSIPASSAVQSLQSPPHAVSAVALPVPGQPLRNYPKCYKSDAYAGGALPSLPYLAAMLAANRTLSVKELCVPAGPHALKGEANLNAPRIHYTFQSMLADQDNIMDGEDFHRWAAYRAIYNRCLVVNFWNASSLCGREAFYNDKIVVIGASNRLRFDRHYTPIGNMAGAEVVINAIKSFAPSEESEDTLAAAVEHKLKIILACVPIWLAFYGIREYLRHLAAEKKSWSWRLGRPVIVFAAFWLALIAVIGVTGKMAFATFSVWVAVLAIAIEQYVEFVTKWILHPFENRLKSLLGISEHAQER